MSQSFWKSCLHTIFYEVSCTKTGIPFGVTGRITWEDCQ